MSGDLAVAPIWKLATEIERRDISPVELVTAVLGQIERLEPHLASYVTVLGERAESEARHAEKEIAGGRHLGPLHGVPIAVKDSIAVSGAPTTNGSRLWADNVTDYDAAVVTRLREAGAIVIGKSNMHEWGMGGTCTGMHFGTVRNPWDLSRVPGGSSGGSAAAVSAGLASGAIGADGWGSIRTPASYCGVVGVKPTQGLVSRFGELPPTSSWHHTLGPIARSVRDAALILDTVAGFDPRDPTSVQQRGGMLEDIDRDAENMVVGIPTSYYFDDAVPAVTAAVDAAGRMLAETGADVVEVDMSTCYDLPLALAAAKHESQSALVPLALAEPGGFVDTEARYRLLANEFVLEHDARLGMQIRNRMVTRTEEVFESVDVILTPCNSTTAFPIGAQSVTVGPANDRVDITRRGGQSRITTRLTLPWNLIGVPAISLPSGRFDEDGLPIAIQLAAGRHREATLFRAAQAYEIASGGYQVPSLVTKEEATRDDGY